MAQNIPAEPKTKKAARHPKWAMMTATSAGVSAAPSLDPACVTPWANPRSEGSIQRESERVAMGNAPASPAPNRNRIAIIEEALHAMVVADVKRDHQRTIAVRARRGP